MDKIGIDNRFIFKGKIVDKPDFFDNLLTFTAFQESTNLSLSIFHECNFKLDVRIGQYVKIEGELFYDSDEDTLFLHAYKVEGLMDSRDLRRRTVIDKPVTEVTEPAVQENTTTKIVVEEPVSEVQEPVTQPVMEESITEVPEPVTQKSGQVIEEPITEVPNSVAEEPVVKTPESAVQQTEDITQIQDEGFEVGLPPLPSDKEVEREEDNSVKEGSTFRRLFNISSTPEGIVNNEEQHVNHNTQTKETVTEDPSNEEGGSRFTISDFDC